MRAPWFAALLLAAGSLHAQPATTVERQGDAIVFRGRIEARSAAAFLDLLQDPGVRRLVITSRGGLVEPALAMAEALHARGLDIDVPEACLSSCANYLFPAGRRKTLGHPAAVGWHGNMTHILYLEQTGQGRWSEAQMQAARMLAARERSFYRRIGVDGFVCWFGKIAPYQAEDFYGIRAADMARFGIADVSVAGAASRDATVRVLAVDWSTLDATRPAVDVPEAGGNGRQAE